MNKEIDNIKKSRIYLLDVIKHLSLKQLNKIPAGFNNNIIWNLGHMVAAQQGLCYVRGGAQIVIEDRYFTDYKPGTKPVAYVNEIEVKTIKDLMLSTIDRLAVDYGTDIFKNYGSFTTRYGAELTGIDDAINFLPYHEGLHSGTIMAFTKIVDTTT
jgi:hypothetical protein